MTTAIAVQKCNWRDTFLADRLYIDGSSMVAGSPPWRCGGGQYKLLTDFVG